MARHTDDLEEVVEAEVDLDEVDDPYGVIAAAADAVRVARDHVREVREQTRLLAVEDRAPILHEAILSLQAAHERLREAREQFRENRERARPMSPEDRRAAILDAVIPLLREHGRDLSTRQIAEAAGVAEGTLFRAFGDKESIIRAAFDRLFDPLPLETAIRSIDRDLPLHDQFMEVIRLLKERLIGVWGVLAAVGSPYHPPFPSATPEEWVAVVEDVFGEHADRFDISMSELARYLKYLACVAVMPPGHADEAITDDQIARLLTGGVLRKES